MAPSLHQLARVVLLDTPSNALWTSVIIWLARVLTISLLLRTHVAPFLLAKLSRHIRVKTVSFRSIRGLYIRHGRKTLTVERIGISYRWSFKEGSSRVLVKIEGMQLEIGSLVLFDDSPLDGRGRTSRLQALLDVWQITNVSQPLFMKFYSFLDPFLRPVLRQFAVTLLRTIIHYVPAISQAVSFDLSALTVTFKSLPGISLSVQRANLHTFVLFTQSNSASRHPAIGNPASRRHSTFSVKDWRQKVSRGFYKSWNRALGEAQGKVSLSLKLMNISGVSDPSIANEHFDKSFLSLPGDVQLSGSICFNPKRGTFDSHSLEVALNLGDASVAVDSIKVLLDLAKQRNIDTAKTTPESRPALEVPLERERKELLGVSSSVAVASPFSNVFSVSSMRGVHQVKSLASKLRKQRNSSMIRILRSAEVNVPNVRLEFNSRSSARTTFAISLKDVAFMTELSHPSRNKLHYEAIGRPLESDSLLPNPDAYFCTFSIQDSSLNRYDLGVKDDDGTCVMALGQVQVEAFSSEWPWAVNTAFFCGDPNLLFLALRVRVASVDITERLDVLLQTIGREGPKTEPRCGGRTETEAFGPAPRLSLGFEVGPINARLACIDRHMKEKSHIICLSSDSISWNLTSTYTMLFTNVMSASPTSLPIRMNLQTSLVVKPIFVRVGQQVHVSSDSDTHDIPTFLSIETIEMIADGSTLGEVGDDDGRCVHLELASTLLDVHCTTEAVCTELWHAKVTEARSSLMAVLSSIPPKPRPTQPQPQFCLPFGLLMKFSVARSILFVAGPSIDPADNSGILRGVAVTMSIYLEYCFIHPRHLAHLKHIADQSQMRNKLFLPERGVVAAVVAAKVSKATKSTNSLLRIAVPRFMLRSASATQYTPDDPHIAEKDDPAINGQECLTVLGGRVDFTSSSKQTADHSEAFPTSLHVSFTAKNVRGGFHLFHAYNFLSALRVVRNFSKSSLSPQQLKSQTSFQLDLSIGTFQVLWSLPGQAFATRVDSVTSFSSSWGSSEVRFEKAFLWVPMPSVVNRWEEPCNEKWEEMLFLYLWSIDLPHPDATINFQAKGEVFRLRVPFGFVTANLIQAVSLSLKCVRHLKLVFSDGNFWPIPVPGPEEAKRIPNAKFKIQSLVIEIADDDFEGKLGLIWRCGLEASAARMEREDAFKAKVARILEAELIHLRSPGDSEYNFNPVHTVPIEEARERLAQVHATDWQLRYGEASNAQQRRADVAKRRCHRSEVMKRSSYVPDIVKANLIGKTPPLFCTNLTGLVLHLTPPSFPLSTLPDYLYKHGKGLPRDTQFSLLVPLHVSFSLSSLLVNLRDYPIPLLDIPASKGATDPALEFSSDLVVAEEIGKPSSVEWIGCSIFGPQHLDSHTQPLVLYVPKIIMPIKSYANPKVRIKTTGATSVSWGVSYAPAIQDLSRVAESFSSSHKDLSPGLGFWDKMRLVFHWTAVIEFRGDFWLRFKGSRDPYSTNGFGAGFVFCWKGNPRILIGQANQANELIQVLSDSMLIAIPNFALNHDSSDSRMKEPPSAFRKICAKLVKGVCFGAGFTFERSCGSECPTCLGTAFDHRCRIFDFRPHYDVKLEKKTSSPGLKSLDDSYNGFRSDFIHLSISLTSGMDPDKQFSSFHLSPNLFAHFWSWFELFDGTLALPVRQGRYFPVKHISLKFSRHLATLKYKILVPRLFVMHAYIDDSRETWVEGVTPFVGVKAMIGSLQADLHQREQEIVVPGRVPGSVQISRHKRFYAVEVVLKEIDLRTLSATFTEPLKKEAQMELPNLHHRHCLRNNFPPQDRRSIWVDLDDFVETDWSSTTQPKIHLIPVVTCPRFAYFKRNAQNANNQVETSKFGGEDTHHCLQGRQTSVSQVQIDLVGDRIAELRQIHLPNDEVPKKMISLLEDYVTHLREANATADRRQSTGNYLMPSDSVSSDEWSEFNNVYQIHCPRIFMDQDSRDILLQYYYCSRTRRGLEYHMATRAVKFIRDQAQKVGKDFGGPERTKIPESSAAAAAQAFRRMLVGDQKSKTSVDAQPITPAHPPGAIDPLNGWAEGVAVRKSHFCLLLKPQIVLACGDAEESNCVLAAVQAKLQSFDIVDESNVEDPVSGKVMSRSYSSLTGLQAFAPTRIDSSKFLPLEVLIDFRCESGSFDRLVPQTDATFHYDKFNRLRLRDNVVSTGKGVEHDHSTHLDNSHLQTHTDLIRVHVPRFTVSANDGHFQSISNVVTKLLLFSDAAHKIRSDKLETMLFTYDFTDLSSSADLISDLQARLRSAMETVRTSEQGRYQPGKVDLLKLKAHVFLLGEELNLLFDAIKLAQDRSVDNSDQKSALLLHASSSEISWRMIDETSKLISKLAVRDIDYSWLSKQDSSTVNKLAIGNLQAFDGSPSALWNEILCKHNEPATHPLRKRQLFLLSNWTVLAPVGGITIYEEFILNLHPMRLQVDAKVGRRIMEYLWPARKDRNRRNDAKNATLRVPDKVVVVPASPSPTRSRSSLDSPRASRSFSLKVPQEEAALTPQLRRIPASRSFTDLKIKASDSRVPAPASPLRRNTSYVTTADHPSKAGHGMKDNHALIKRVGGAAEMKSRSHQKTFVYVRVSSLNLLLSIIKEDSFEFRDARIKTHDLEYRNQTWSFEELVHQFIPTDTSWKGWVKIALQQPLIPVLPVARELLSKTKWIPHRGNSSGDALDQPKNGKPSTEKDQTPIASRAHDVVGARLVQLHNSDNEMDLPKAKSRPRLRSMFPRHSPRKQPEEVNNNEAE